MAETQKIKIIPKPAVNGVVFNGEGKVLLTRRSVQIRAGGCWCLPGGHLDGGEDWRTAMRREIQEEVGIEVTCDVLMGIYSDPKVTVTEEVSKEGHLEQFVTVVFKVLEWRGTITPNEEVDKWDWFDLDSLPLPMLRSHPVRIEDAFAFKGEVFVR